MQTIEDMLRTCVLDFRRNWDGVVKSIKFVNSNNHGAIEGVFTGVGVDSQPIGAKLEGVLLLA